MSEREAARLRLRRGPGLGMIALRCAPHVPGLGEALGGALGGMRGAALPERGRIVSANGGAVAWMSPDEWLLLCPRERTAGLLERLSRELAGEHHLLADVSDARAVFTLSGPGWREALARLGPADVSPAGFGAGMFRRSRLGQVAAAFWISGPDELRLFCRSSVAGYMEALLEGAARGEGPGIFDAPGA